MKLKRLLTAALSAVMALSVCALPAMAEESGTPATTTPQKTASVIDTGKTGSITIYKYLHAEDIQNVTGTGETQNVPDGTEPAEDVGFTIYQVKNADELVAYYNGVDNASAPATAKASDYITAGKVKTIYDKKIPGSNEVAVEKKTDKNGEVKFTDLPVGLYLVIETSKPATVTTPVEPFLVSIPMTRVTTDVNAQKEWLYDVVVYPKNSTHKGAITLKKLGVTGTVETPLAGVEFTLERKKDDTAETWVRCPDESTVFTTTDADGSVTINGLMPGTYRFKEVGYASGVADANKKYVINAGDYYVFTISDNGTITKPNTAEHSSDYTAENTTVTVKNYAPDIDKQVKDKVNATYQKAADYNVGDEIPYKITVTVPQNITRLKKFEVTDTPTNLVDQVKDAHGNILISVQYQNDESLADVAAEAYAIADYGAGGFKVTFDTSKMSAYAGKQIVISYNAKLTASADMTTVGNKNQAKLEYSNKTDVAEGDKDKDENKYNRGDDAVVYTFQIQILKKADVKDGNGKDIYLKDVTFDLYKKVATNAKLPDDATTITEAEANKLKLSAAGEGYQWAKVKSDITTDENGKATVTGLANGTYYLVETKTNQGYNLLAAPVEATLNIAYKTTWSETSEYKDGVLVKHDVTKKEEKFTTRDSTNGGSANGTEEDGKTYGRYATTIVNRKGFQLPVTGGFGTLLFSGIGVLLVLAGVSVLFSLKKKNKRA